MKKLFVLLAILFTSCTATKYVYIVDDVYHSRPLDRRPNTTRPFHGRPSITPPLPFQYWYWQPYYNQPWQRVPGKSIGPRKENLNTYGPQLPPPPPPIEKKEDQKTN